MPHCPNGWQCLDPGTVSGVEVRRFNGRNWEATIEASGIAELSKSASRASGLPSSPTRSPTRREVCPGGGPGGGGSQLAVPREALGGPHPWLRSWEATPPHARKTLVLHGYRPLALTLTLTLTTHPNNPNPTPNP